MWHQFNGGYMHVLTPLIIINNYRPVHGCKAILVCSYLQLVTVRWRCVFFCFWLWSSLQELDADLTTQSGFARQCPDERWLSNPIYHWHQPLAYRVWVYNEQWLAKKCCGQAPSCLLAFSRFCLSWRLSPDNTADNTPEHSSLPSVRLQCKSALLIVLWCY